MNSANKHWQSKVDYLEPFHVFDESLDGLKQSFDYFILTKHHWLILKHNVKHNKMFKAL